MQYVTVEKDAGGLTMKLLPEAREDLRELHAEKSLGDAEAEVLEHIIANGFIHVPPEAIGALTSAPIISDDANIEDDGSISLTPDGRVYYFDMYQVRSFIDDLLETGEAHWEGA